MDELKAIEKAHLLVQLLGITYPYYDEDGRVLQLSVLEEGEQDKAVKELFRLLGI